MYCCAGDVWLGWLYDEKEVLGLLLCDSGGCDEASPRRRSGGVFDGCGGKPYDARGPTGGVLASGGCAGCMPGGWYRWGPPGRKGDTFASIVPLG